jgi:hypothetical protein
MRTARPFALRFAANCIPYYVWLRFDYERCALHQFVFNIITIIDNVQTIKSLRANKNIGE